jgi:hypothetical protein
MIETRYRAMAVRNSHAPPLMVPPPPSPPRKGEGRRVGNTVMRHHDTIYRTQEGLAGPWRPKSGAAVSWPASMMFRRVARASTNSL